MAEKRKDAGGWVWKAFTGFALFAALGPGFLLGILAATAPSEGIQRWYIPLTQAHGTLMVMGWGYSVILGVALHFLPRLRGAPLCWPMVLPGAFGCHAAGIVLQVIAQALPSATDASGSHSSSWLLGAGIVLRALGIFLALGVLVGTARTGPPLEKRKGFIQILPPLITVGAALVLAHILWLLGAVQSVRAGHNMLPSAINHAALEVALIGGVMAISIGMSARLFPLTFRSGQASRTRLMIASALLLMGIVLTAAKGIAGAGEAHQLFGSFGALALALGILAGSASVLVWKKRPEARTPSSSYRIGRDPAGVGMLMAYGWAVIAALLLLIVSWRGIVPPQPRLDPLLMDAVRHAMGSGFMTLLIISVGWTMLPGFAGSSPQGRGWMWAAVTLASLATLMRVLPPLLVVATESGGALRTHGFASAGAMGWLGIACFAYALKVSFRSKGAVSAR